RSRDPSYDYVAFRLLLPLLLAPTTDDQPVAGLVRPAGAALRLTLRVHRVATARGLALTTTVRVVDRVHRDTADRRTLALPTVPAGLADADVGLLGVPHLADGGPAAHVDHAHLAGRHAQGGVVAFLGEQLDLRPGAPRQLGAAPRTQLHRVDEGTGRDVAERQAVARLDVRRGTVLDQVPLLEPDGREDVALLAVGVVEQRDPGGPVRVVLDVRDLRRDPVLVVAAEVDDPVGALVSASLVPGGDPAVVVTAALAVEGGKQRLLGPAAGDVGEVRDARAATARGRRLVLTDA